MSGSRSPRDDGERQSDLAVMEKTEFKQKHRLNQLLKAHDKVEEQANEAWELLVLGEVNHDAKNIMIQRAVKEFIREGYNLLLEYNRGLKADADDDDGESVDDVYWEGVEDKPLGIISRRREDDISIYGLSDFIQTNEIYRDRWKEQVKRRNMPPKEVTKEVEQSVPEDVSWRAYLRLRRFLNQEYNLDLQFDGDELDEDTIVPDY